MPRPGGNPDLYKSGFQAAGEEPIIHTFNVKLAESMKSKLDSMGKSKSEFVRKAIAKALEELDKKSGENPTDN